MLSPKSLMGPGCHAHKSNVSFQQYISVMEKNNAFQLKKKINLDIVFQKHQSTALPSTPREN